MVEKAKFERKEKRNHVLRCIFIVMLGIMLVIGYVVISASAIELYERSRTVFCIPMIICVGLTSIAGFGVLERCKLLFENSRNAMEREVKNFQFNMEVDELLRHLEKHGEIPARFKLGLNSFPKRVRSLVKIRKRSFLVRKEDPESLYIGVYKGKKEVECWTVDYDFFFEYFEPIYSQKENE